MTGLFLGRECPRALDLTSRAAHRTLRRAVRPGFALALVIGMGCTEPTKPPPVLDERHVITVEGSAIRYNGKLLSWDVPTEKWQAVLGPRSRKVDDASVWDDLGVYVYDDRRKSLPRGLGVLLGRKRHSPDTDTEPAFWPKQTFRGRLLLDGALLHAGSTVAEVNRDKEGEKLHRRYLPTIYDYDLADVSVGLELGYDRTPTALEIGLHPPP